MTPGIPRRLPRPASEGLAYLGHVLLDNRHGLVANVCATHATGTAEREAAALLRRPARRRAARSEQTRATMWRASLSVGRPPHVAQLECD